jgi:hypothetical protein
MRARSLPCNYHRTVTRRPFILHRVIVPAARRLWAAPNTLLGLVAGVMVVCLGGRMQVVRGAAEFSAGLLGAVAGAMPRALRFSAVTLGHVIVGISATELAAARDHEHVHVRQYEKWGPLFLFAYIASSLWQLALGRRVYRDNFFERQAYAMEAGERPRRTV